MKTNKYFLIAILFFISCLIYAKTIFFQFVWDDKSLIVDNPYLRQPIHLIEIFSNAFWKFSQLKREGTLYYRPITTLLFITEFKIWAAQPAYYHLVNVVLHSLCTSLLFLISTHFLNDQKKGFLISLLFVVHPAVSSSVSWISCQSDLLSTSLFLFSFLIWIRKKPSQFAALPFLLLSMLSKETLVLGPVILFFYDLTIRKPTRNSYLSLLLIPIYFGMRAFAMEQVLTGLSQISFEGGYRILLYMGRILLPLPLAPREMLQSISVATQYSTFAVFVFIAFFSIYVSRKYPTILFSTLWFWFAILPIAGFTSQSLRFSDQLLYFSLTSACVLSGIFLSKVNIRYFTFFIFIVLGSISFTRTDIWKDDISLWSYNYSKHPTDIKTNINYAVALFDGDRPEQGCKIFESLAKRNQTEFTPKDFSLIQYNLGNCLVDTKAHEAYIAYHLALEQTPSMWPARFNLILILQNTKQYKKAEEESQKFTQISPDLSISWKTLGYSAYYNGHYAISKDAFERTLELNKNDPEASSMLEKIRNEMNNL